MTQIVPVIHIINKEQANANIQLCIKHNIKKVFLISHGYMLDSELLEFSTECKEKYGKLWIGVNLLGTRPEVVVSLNSIVDAFWIDQTITAEIMNRREFKGQIFGGLAFKYQPQPKDLENACKNAKIFTDVAVTSGSGTGKEISYIKLSAIRTYIGSHKLAVASGVNKNNAKNLSELASYLMVASSITNLKTELIIEDELVKLINSIK